MMRVLHDWKMRRICARGGALARKSAQEAKITALSEHGDALERAAAETEKSRAPCGTRGRAIDEPRR